MGRAIAALAARQHGVVWYAQLRRLGLSKDAIKRRIAAGLLHPLYRGVYAVGHPAVTIKGRFLAAVVACGPRAALSHRAAAHLQELQRAPRWIDVTVPRVVQGPTSLEVHRSRMLEERDFRIVDGIRVTAPARTLLDLAAIVSATELARVVDRAERLELFDLAAVQDVLDRARGRKGAAALRRAVDGYRQRHTRSELEDRFLDLVTTHGLPQPQMNVLVHGHEVDACWPEHRLVVELDSFSFHRTRADHEHDMARDADLELAGLRVMRIDWRGATTHAARTARRLRRALAA